MSKAGRPAEYPHKKLIGFDADQLAAIEQYRRTQSPIPNFSEAIRRLVWAALDQDQRG